MERDVLDPIARLANLDDGSDDAPLEIQLMRTIRALRDKLAEPDATLTVDARKALEQKLRDTELRLNVVHELHGHASLANPERIL